MGLFDKLFGINTNSSAEMDSSVENAEHSGGVKEKALEFTIGNVRKYYNKKSEFISKIAKTKRECSFFDRNLNNKNIEAKIKNLKDLQNQVSIKKSELAKASDELEKSKSTLLNLQNSIDRLLEKRKIIPTFNTIEWQRIENEIGEQAKYQCTMKEICEKREKEIKDINKQIAELERNIQITAGETLETMISDPEINITDCKGFVSEYKLNSGYETIVIPAVEAFRIGDFDKASELLREYFSQNEPDNFHLSLIYGKTLYENKNYDEARKHLEYAVQHLPQSMELHQMLECIYRELRDITSMTIEKDIYKMLED